MPAIETRLRHAVTAGDVPRLEQLLLNVDDLHTLAPDAVALLLEIAVSRGHVDALQLLLDRGMSPPSAAALFHLASVHGHTRILELLFQRLPVPLDPSTTTATTMCGFGANAQDERRRTWQNQCAAMLWAAQRGDIAAVRQALDANKSLANSMNELTGETAFSAAFTNGHRRLCELLLARGAAPVGVCFSELLSKSRHVGCSLVQLAVIQQNAPLVRWLLDVGANCEAFATDQPSSALATAASIGNVEIVEMLLASSARLDAEQCCSIAPPPSMSVEVWRIEDERDIGDSRTDVTPFLLLAIATLKRHRRLFDHVLKTKKALHDRQAMARFGRLALGFAVSLKAKDVVHELLAAGCSANSPVESDDHPMSAAMRVDAVDMLRQLLAADDLSSACSPPMWTTDLNPLLELGAEFGAVACLTELIDRGVVAAMEIDTSRALERAIEKGHVEVTALLVERTLPSPLRPEVLSCCLSYAGEANSPVMLELISSHTPLSASILQSTFNEACLRGSLASAAYLLAHGVDVNTPIGVGTTFLLHQVLHKVGRGRVYVEVAQLLVDANADPNALDELGETPLSVVHRQRSYIRTPAGVVDVQDAEAMLIRYGAHAYR